MQYHLNSLSLKETTEYLDHRLCVAGGQPGLFLPGAVERIYRYSGGIPRKINHAASLALLEGFGREVRVIGPEVLDDVMLELDLVFSPPKELTDGSC
jgi:type II secretory pathway predicted ATPase ExeA